MSNVSSNKSRSKMITKFVRLSLSPILVQKKMLNIKKVARHQQCKNTRTSWNRKLVQSD